MKKIPLISALLLSVSFLAVAQREGDNRRKLKIPEIAEVFRVSNVGAANVAETREMLKSLYDEIGAEYNAKAQREASSRQIAYQGNRVRILQVLSESENGAAMYVTAYGGRPSVFAIEGEKYSPGDITPALQITPSGEHKTSVTREIVEKTKKSTPKPALEKVDSSGAVSFFGIPIDVGGGSAAPAPQETEVVTRRKVTEEKTMPKYSATISKAVLNDGPPKFSKELFLESVKNGTIYTIQRNEKRRCQNCRGFKRVQTNLPIGLRASDGKMPCPECNGVGTIEWDVTYKVTW